MSNGFSFTVPVKAASASNLREHHMARHRRTSAQKDATRRRCPEWVGGALLVVTLTRVAPRRLDDDNLRGALKSVRDAVASWLRVDDATPLVRWEYAQEKGLKPLVMVSGSTVWPQYPLALPRDKAPLQPRTLAELATPAHTPAKKST